MRSNCIEEFLWLPVQIERCWKPSALTCLQLFLIALVFHTRHRSSRTSPLPVSTRCPQTAQLHTCFHFPHLLCSYLDLPPTCASFDRQPLTVYTCLLPLFSAGFVILLCQSFKAFLTVLCYLMFWRHVICLCQTFLMFWGFFVLDLFFGPPPCPMSLCTQYIKPWLSPLHLV